MKWSGIVAAAFASVLVAGASRAESFRAGAVYAASNQADGNRLLAFDRGDDGSLVPAGSFSTGGRGTGGGLGNQGGVILSSHGNWIFVVNAGSDDISTFWVGPRRLHLVGRVASGGRRPVSLTLHRDLLYVLNAGGQAGSADNLAGFRIQRFGQLDPIAGSVHPLSAPSTGPAEISFSPEGDFLVVTEKTENKILTFPVDEEGVAGPAVENPSAGTTPFGFAFDREGDLLVSEALGGAADASALSSYQLGDDGGLTVLDPSVPTKETAACWVVATHDGRFAYVTNTGSGTISGFSIDENGQLALLNAADGITATTGPAPIDAALARGSRFLFELETGAIRGFEIARDGALRQVSTLEGLPPAANGLAAR